MATLVYCDAEGAGARYQLRGKEILIGRTDECAIRSDDPLVAPRHARLFEQSGQYWIEDLGSSTGVFIGNQRVSQSVVPFGELVLVGNLALRIDAEEAGANGQLFDHGQLIAQLAAALDIQRKLEEERNALGHRLGELHQELRAAQAAAEAATAEAEAPSEPTTPLGAGFEPNMSGLEELAGKLREAEGARREIEKKIATAERRRAQTSSEVEAAESESLDGDPSDVEVRQVQLLSLRAQRAEAEKTVERLRNQLATRNKEIAALRARARSDSSPQPATTQEYSAVPDTSDDDDDNKVAELKARFEAEFARAVTLQQKLKTAEERLIELEASQSEGQGEAASQRARAERLAAEKAMLESKLESLESAAAEAGASGGERVASLESKVEDLKKLLEGARRETSAAREKVADARKKTDAALARQTELEDEMASRADKAIKAEERIGALEAKLAQRDKLVAEKDRELTDMAAAVAISAESESKREALEKKLTALERDAGGVADKIARAESSRDSALAARRELEARVLGAESAAKESLAKLEHAERKAEQAKAGREKAEKQLGEVKADLVVAREARLAAEQELNAKRQRAAGGVEDTAVISLRRRLSENQQEASAELERLEGRVRELEEDLDRALDAERAALARIDVESDALQSKVDRLEAELAKLTDEVETLRPNLAAATRRADDAEQLVSDLERDLEQNNVTAGRVEELESELHKMRIQANRVKSLEASLDEARSVAAEQARRMASLEEDAKAAESVGSATVDLRARVVELASQNARMSSEMSALSEEHQAAETRAAELADELEATRVKIRELGAENKSIESAHQDLTRRYDQVSADLQRSADDLDTLRRHAEGSADVERDAAELQREVLSLRDRIAELEVALSTATSDNELETTAQGGRTDTLSDVHEFTTPASPTMAVSEWMMALRAAVGDLRKAMRTASDEAAIMPPGESVEVINNALSTAVERVETARDAIRQLAQILDLN